MQVKPYKVLHWSPDASHVAIVWGEYATVLAVSSGTECQIGPVASFGGFIDDERVLAAMPRRSTPGQFANRPSTVSIYSPECGLKATWQYPRKINRILAAGPPAIGMVYEEDEGYAVLLDPLTGTILHELPKMAYNPSFQFGDRGKVLCVGHQPAGTFNVPMSCYDSRRGAEVLPRCAVRNGAPFDMAWGSPVLVAMDAYRKAVPFSFDTRFVPEAWVVWDLRRGATVMRLRQPKLQQNVKAAKPDEWHRTPTATLLPEGQGLVIGVDETLSLFEMAGTASSIPERRSKLH